MNHDAATADRLRVNFVDIITKSRGIVVDRRTRAVRYLDSELIGATSTDELSIGRSEQETVASDPVKSARALVLPFSAGDNQPLIRGAVKIHVRDLELEFSLARGNLRSLFVLGAETEIGLPDQCGIWHVSASP